MRSEEPMALWLELPECLVRMIAEKLLVRLDDYVRFRAVCIPWRAATLDPRRLDSLPPTQLPWLMLSFSESSDLRTFYRLSDGKIIRLWLPEARGCRIIGCTDGWLALVDNSLAVRLLNPLTKAQVHLPSLTTLTDFLKRREEVEGEDYEVEDEEDDFVVQNDAGQRYTQSTNKLRDLFIRKLVLASTSTEHHAWPVDAIVVAHLANVPRMAFAKAEGEEWMLAEKVEGMPLIWNDFLRYRGTIYAVARFGVVAVCEVGPPARVKPIFLAPERTGSGCNRWYLVESLGELLLVARYMNHTPQPFPSAYPTAKFEVFKLTDLNGAPKAAEVKSLGDRVLFLGTNRSMSLAARDLPSGKPNRIYFTACCFDVDSLDRNHYLNDFGVFDLENGSIEPLPGYFDNSKVVWPPLIWFTPSLC